MRHDEMMISNSGKADDERYAVGHSLGLPNPPVVNSLTA